MKKSIAILSVLKPIDDPRQSLKIGKTLSELGHDVHIFGRAVSHEIVSIKNITFHPHFIEKRLSAKRFLLPLILIKKIYQLKLDYIVVNSYEYQLIIFLYKILFGAKIVYDVRENYGRNIRFQSKKNVLLKKTISFFINSFQLINVPFVYRFILAEKVYQKQLSYLPKKRTVVVQNKALFSESKEKLNITLNHPLHFCITGTLSPQYMTEECIRFFLRYQQKFKTSKLTIAGYSPDSKFARILINKYRQHPSINMIGVDHSVAYTTILNVIKEAHIGFCFNQQNPSFYKKMPTKIFEYLQHQLIVLYDKNEVYHHVIQPYPAGISLDINENDIKNINQKLTSTVFYTSVPQNVTWGEEEKNILRSIFLD